MRVTGNLSRTISRARRAVFEVLEGVSTGAYASDLLRERTRDLDRREAGLASQVVFGCLRFQGQLDHLITRYSGRKAQDLDSAVRLALRVAIFQLRYLDRIPAHAAVHESVEYVKARKRAAAGLTNAVLRKVDRESIEWPDRATELSCPEWLLRSWERHFGTDVARRIADAALREPTPYVRVAPGAEFSPEMKLEATDVPGAYRLLSSISPGVRLQDIGSQALVTLLNLESGDSYLDLCAAPGNKTLQALETSLRLAVACDISFKRLREVPPVCPRLVLDAAESLPFNMQFDRILVDAPCSGTGTLARNPEIKWRVTEQDFARFQEKQRAILSQAVSLLAPGGKIVYATCSLEREENEDVVSGVLHGHPELVCEQEMWRVPGREEGDGFYAARLAIRLDRR